jgi:hypothetical protein
VSSPAVPWQRFLTVEIFQLHALKSSLHSLPCRTQLNSLSSKPLGYNISSWTTQKTLLLLLRACMLQALRSNGRCLQSHRLATGLYDTIIRACLCVRTVKV